MIKTNSYSLGTISVLCLFISCIKQNNDLAEMFKLLSDVWLSEYFVQHASILHQTSKNFILILGVSQALIILLGFITDTKLKNDLVQDFSKSAGFKHYLESPVYPTQMIGMVFAITNKRPQCKLPA